ncbi:MAG: class II glutamine amidotransferase [Candidatus Lokiarchaeota archaeon]|nr:class II glutamine amidotransferase [Candidatus Harpocratesius repetitus]
MCRMFAAMGSEIPLKEIIEKFSQLAIYGNVPADESPGHQDGWGVVLVPNFKWDKAIILKNTKSIINDQLLDKLNPYLEGTFAGQIFCHLRKASSGLKALENTHPFEFSEFFFMHNGTIYFSDDDIDNFKKTFPTFSLKRMNMIDSEIYGSMVEFFFKQNGDLINSWQKVISWIKNRKIKHSSVSAAILMNQKLGAIRSFTKQSDYYTLYWAQNSNYIMISQEKIINCLWNEVDPDSTVIFKIINDFSASSGKKKKKLIIEKEEFQIKK